MEFLNDLAWVMLGMAFVILATGCLCKLANRVFGF